MAPLTVKPAEEKRLKGEGFLSNKGTDNFNARVITINGNIDADKLAVVAEAAKKFGNGQVQMTTRLTLEVAGIPYDQVEPFQAYLARAGLVTGGTGPKVRPVVSCKGTTCQYGNYDTFALSEKIHHLFYEGYRPVALPHKFKIACGGCPNNCVKPTLNDVGVVGYGIPKLDLDKCRGCKVCAVENCCPVSAGSHREDGKLQIDPDKCIQCGRCIERCHFAALPDSVRGYRVFVGGRWGKETAHGKPLGQFFTSEQQVLNAIESAILLFKEQGKAGERFATVVNRLGMEYVNRVLTDGEILKRKEEILGK